MFRLICLVQLLSLAFADMEAAARLLFKGGGQPSTFFYCNLQERRVIHSALLQAMDHQDHPDMDASWCFAYCDKYAQGSCWLVHPKCSSVERKDVIAEDEESILPDISPQVLDSHSDMALVSKALLEKCSQDKEAIAKAVDRLTRIPMFSTSCSMALHHHIDVDCVVVPDTPNFKYRTASAGKRWQRMD